MEQLEVSHLAGRNIKYINYKTATEENDLADVAGSIIFLTPCPVNSTTPKSSPKMKIHSHTNPNTYIGSNQLIQDWPTLPDVQPGMTHKLCGGMLPGDTRQRTAEGSRHPYAE